MVCVFLDFSKAFDAVDHNILLKKNPPKTKTDQYGICGFQLKWFEDNLPNRLHTATCNNHKSSHEKSVVGYRKVLFLLYDLTTVSEFCFSVLFTDDTDVFLTGKDMNVLRNQLNEDLRNVQEKLQCNKLSLNVLKSHCMVFTPRNKLINAIDVKYMTFKYRRSVLLNFRSSDWCTVDLENAYRIHMQEIVKCVGILCKARKKYINLLSSLSHDDVIKWKYFSRCWPFVRGMSSPHKGQWRGALMFSLICARINGWVNNGEAGDLIRRLAHCDVTIMYYSFAYPYRQVSNIRRTLVGNYIVDHSDVVGASPIGAAPTTSSFWTLHLASKDWPKTTSRRDENHLSFLIWCVLY